jgi:nucleotide-binding universal stress UspA family protein
MRSVAERPWPKRTKIKIVSVLAPPELVSGPLEGVAEALDRAEELKKKQAQEALSAAGHILRGAGLKSAGVVLVGDARTRILDEAQEWGADLIVLGAQGRGGVDRILQGSVSEAVAVHAPCSVEVIRNRNHLFFDRSGLMPALN